MTRSAVFGFVLAIATILITAVTTALFISAPEWMGRIGAVRLWVFNASIVTFAVLGALITWARPGNAVGWLFNVIALVHSLSSLLAGYAGRALYADPGLPFGVVAAWAFVWTAALHYGPSGTILVLIFPDGRTPSARWRPLVYLGLIGTAGLALGTALLPGPLIINSAFENPYGVQGPLALVIAGASTVVLTVVAIGSWASLFARFGRATGLERQQIKVFFYGAAGLVVAAIVVLALGIPLEDGTSSTALR